jgi:hypothetical protein
MKITKSHRNPLSKRTLTVSGVLAVLLFICSLTYVYKFDGHLFGWSAKKDSTSSIDYTKPTQEQKSNGQSAKESFVEKYYPNDSSTLETDTDNSAKTKNIGFIISSIAQTTDQVQIRTIIQTLSGGICTLTMTKAGQASLTRTVDVQNLGSYSTCKGFDLPTSDLSLGIWNVNLVFKNDSESGQANQEVEIK